jgi:NAD(P)-dependent dehydrogenase (short-subunit alcohol dehydrogenase family)
MSPYENQVVIITAGSSGIGRSAVLAFGEKGAFRTSSPQM